MKNGTKIKILLSVLSIIILILLSFIVLLVINMNKDKKFDKEEDVETTTVVTEETTTNNNVEVVTVPTDSNETTTSNVETTTKSIDNKNTTTTKTVTRTTVKKSSGEQKTTTSGSSSYTLDYVKPVRNTISIDTLGDWEKKILNDINTERRNNGLKELGLVEEFVNKAKEGTDYWYGHSENDLSNYLDGYAYYGKVTNALVNSRGVIAQDGYKEFIYSTKRAVDLTTNPRYEYVGLNIKYLEKGYNRLPTHYYVIIFE